MTPDSPEDRIAELGELIATLRAELLVLQESNKRDRHDFRNLRLVVDGFVEEIEILSRDAAVLRAKLYVVGGAGLLAGGVIGWLIELLLSRMEQI